MLIEREDAVVLEEGEYLADSVIGGLWTSFRKAIPPMQATELNKAFNLIMLADGDSLMPSQLATVLVDEYTDTPSKKQSAYVVIATNIIEVLKTMGVTLNEDVAGEDKLSEMATLLDFFFELREYQDLIGLKGLLESYDIPPVNRYLQAMKVFWGEEFDISEFECLIEDVSEVTLKSIKDALFNPDDVENPPEPLQRRIVANKAFLEGSLAFGHVTRNGQLGGSMTSFLSFYKAELDEILEEDIIKYGKEIVCFFIISEINNEWLKDKATQYLYSIISDVIALVKIEALIEEVVLP